MRNSDDLTHSERKRELKRVGYRIDNMEERFGPGLAGKFGFVPPSDDYVERIYSSEIDAWEAAWEEYCDCMTEIMND